MMNKRTHPGLPNFDRENALGRFIVDTVGLSPTSPRAQSIVASVRQHGQLVNDALAKYGMAGRTVQQRSRENAGAAGNDHDHRRRMAAVMAALANY